jgi:hypothetical protein
MDERLLWIADRSDPQREPATKQALEYYRYKRFPRYLEEPDILAMPISLLELSERQIVI